MASGERRGVRSSTKSAFAEAFTTAAIRVLSCLPAATFSPLGRTIGLATDFLGLRPARTTDTNLALVDPSAPARVRRALARRSLVEDARLALALPSVWCGDPDRLLDGLDGAAAARRLEAARGRGRGVLLLVPHLGNWELLCLWLQAQAGPDLPFTALYEPLRDPGLDRWLHTRRERSGARLVPTDASGLRALLRTLGAGGVAALLPDQVPPPGAGVAAPFHGRDALTMTLVRGLVRRCAPEVLAMTAVRSGRRHVVHVRDGDAGLGADDPRTAAAALNRTIEACVALAPEQYQWGYKRYRHAAPGGADYYTVRRPKPE